MSKKYNFVGTTIVLNKGKGIKSK